MTSSKPEPLYQEQILALGALVDISIWGIEPGAARHAADEITADFNRIHTTWHAWKPSELTRINAQLVTGNAFSVNPEMIPLLVRARVLSQASDHLFNPAIGQLLARWGFQGDEAKGPPPDPAVIHTLIAQHPTLDDVVIEYSHLRSTNRAVQLDVGAIGQGYAVDVAIAHLRKLGIENAMVNASGDIRVIGRHGNRPWRIGIRDPRGSGILASIELHGDESIVTSGTYERYFDYAGKRYHHIIDPRTGYPAQGTLSVTVLARDAASTALVLALAYTASQRLPGAGLSALGYSVLAALAHMAGQFAVAYTLFIPHPALLHLLPVLMSAAVIFGAVSGIIAQAMLTEAGS
ncbi:MAG: Gx transporter family protein [Gammaproteobacteria bacterium]|nr:Gx transporter family protein [Gammaproteobacteria bacterium]